MSAVWATFLGWTLDAFDFFLVVFCLTTIGKEFGKSDAQMALSLTVTLAFRPVGAFLFGILADRYGRRTPLIINILFYSIAEAFTGLVHTYMAFMILRALFGIGMGGQWGIGASLAMEKVPAQRRGLLSGLLQQGYAAGSLLAAICYLLLLGKWGWRPLFFVGCIPALFLVVFVYFRVRESEVWERSGGQDWRGLAREFGSHWRLFVYLTVFMMMMLFASHGTQDMYPTFLQRQWHFTSTQSSAITAFSMVGAIIGGIVTGHLSDRWGRRRAMISAFVVGILIIPLWAYAPSKLLLILGAFLMQFMVQGAWGVIPAHLTELAPDSVRASLPGLAYHCGLILSSLIVYIEAVFAEKASYATAMALTALFVFALASIVAALGREQRGTVFGTSTDGG